MNLVIFTLSILVVIIIILVILFLIPVAPFNPVYINPNPRNWVKEPYPEANFESISNFQKVFDYGEYSLDFADPSIYNTYRYFFCDYCTRNPKVESCLGYKIPQISTFVPGVTIYDDKLSYTCP